MQKNLAVSSSPHLRDSMSTQRIMQEVSLALAPAGIAAIILYGMNAAMLIAAAVSLSLFAASGAPNQKGGAKDGNRKSY